MRSTKHTLDSKNTLLNHKKQITSRKFLKDIYVDFYSYFKRAKVPTGKLVELGSGGGFLKEVIPGVITSDVLGGPGIDKVFKAEKMPFKSSSIAAFFMLNTFHHIKDPQKALSEMNRCLVKGGKVVMVETYNTPWASFIYRNFHHEHFDSDAGWEIKGKRRLSDSNQAVPWIVFERDRKKYETLFPKLKIKSIKVHTPFLYLLSGGLSKRSLVPANSYPLFKYLENLLSPLNKNIGMFATITLEKTS